MIFYRYEGYEHLWLDKYELVKETKCGYWIKPMDTNDESKPRFVLKLSKKKYAHLDIEDAIWSYRKRKLRQMEHLRIQLDRVTTAASFSSSIEGLRYMRQEAGQ